MLKYNFNSKLNAVWHWINENKIGFVFILVATALFFAPLLPKLSTYSEGGDAMFNAWLISRNHNCILQNNCPDYTTANIYFPNKDTMLYSETELSAAVLTLPLYLINKNPIFAYNILTILSFFFAGIFMYLLAKYLSKGNEPFSVMAGLIFAFAPIKIAAISHLQNLSIFYLPLIVLFILKYFDKPQKKFLFILYILLVMQFYASWYQMVFVMLPVAGIVIAYAFMKGGLRRGVNIGLTVLAAILTTLPLALQYVKFAKSSDAAFSMLDQVKYAASLKDYFIPYEGTLFGKIYYLFFPNAQHNSYNPDSFSYIGYGFVLVAILTLFLLVRHRNVKQFRLHKRLIITLGVVGIVAFVASLGPLLKIDAKPLDYIDPASGTQVLFPLPYIFVDKLLPQLSFIRAIGRIAIILLFVFCCLLALLPQLSKNARIPIGQTKQRIIAALLLVIIALEMLPVHRMIMSSNSFNYNLKIPAAYQYIKQNPSVHNFIILASDPDYPGATIPMQRAEWVLWAGYHNKNIFNGYSGYTPKNYFEQYGDFLDFDEGDVTELKNLGIDHVLVDKKLSTSDKRVLDGTSTYLKHVAYEDDRYVLYQVSN